MGIKKIDEGVRENRLYFDWAGCVLGNFFENAMEVAEKIEERKLTFLIHTFDSFIIMERKHGSMYIEYTENEFQVDIILYLS